jgi:hypothetical protein
MKKVVLASLLAIACAFPLSSVSHAQGGIQMSQEEYAVYNACTPLTAAAKAGCLEGYLVKYPTSAVKNDVLNQILFNYLPTNDASKITPAADNVLAVDPANLRALTLEVYYRRPQADALTDPAAKAAALDTIVGYADKGIAAAKAPAPKGTTADEWKTAVATAIPIFYSVKADDANVKKDYPTAITNYLTELHAADKASLESPSPTLQDVFFLGQAYLNSKDFLNCAWYADRAAAFAGQFAAQITPTAQYCYTKYHGKPDGFEQLTALVKASFDPPATLATTITPAPKPSDIVAQLIASTPDLAALAVSDREFAIQYGNTKDPKSGTVDPATGKIDPATQKTYSDEVFDSVKGKSVEFPDALVIAATTTSIQVAITDDAVQSKTADFIFNLTEPLKEDKVPAAGAKVTLTGTYASYTNVPLITMSDGAIVPPKPAAKPKPTVHHTTKH